MFSCLECFNARINLQNDGSLVEISVEISLLYAKLRKVGQRKSRNSGGGVKFLQPAGATRHPVEQTVFLCKSSKCVFNLTENMCIYRNENGRYGRKTFWKL